VSDMPTELDLDTDPTIGSTGRLRAMMRERYPAPEWAFFEEVPDTTGLGGRGYADGVAMSLYPSRGLTVHGFELKVSRSDWLTELKKPAKAETIFRYCDHWWLVVGDRKIVKAGELPAPWGLIAPRGNGLAVIVQAPKLEPVALSRRFVAALARRAHSISETALQDGITKATADLKTALAAARQRGARQEPQPDQAAERLRKEVAEFEAASGLSIRNGWTGGKEIGRVVHAYLNGKLEKHRLPAERALHIAENIAGNLKLLIDALPTEDRNDHPD